ncbi:hypothetical protein [Kordiimonas gwangyangensis]|uniref:hypothetical protein n=1 Tax=Kordiimonas gwangyangensis TaxID=288022 RepID=UPI0012DC0153|nr:hypothetical protein [Kordiimonas gwangyangensis]
MRLSEPAPTLDVWLLSHSDTRSSARMRVFRQFIGDRASEIEAALAGRLHARENTAVS